MQRVCQLPAGGRRGLLDPRSQGLAPAPEGAQGLGRARGQLPHLLVHSLQR